MAEKLTKLNIGWVSVAPPKLLFWQASARNPDKCVKFHVLLSEPKVMDEDDEEEDGVNVREEETAQKQLGA